MSGDSTKLRPAADEVMAGLRLMAEAAATRSSRKLRRLVLRAAGHFDAARTLNTMATTEIGRQMQRDMKSQMAGVTDLFSRAHGLSEGDSPFGP